MVNHKKVRFKKVLIANRGEIAARIARTLRMMDIPSVAVFSEIDRASLHVRLADQAFLIGPAPAAESYLRPEKILEVAKTAGCDAIHPGYGFLSENAAFAAAVQRAGITLIGPPAEAMQIMGSKTRAREHMYKTGVPCVPGTHQSMPSVEEAANAAARMGYPVMLKAAAGGGGKGMRAVAIASEFARAYQIAQSEAQNAFGDPTMYLEKVIQQPRHIEIQIFADTHGQVVWLGERECSMQRRHQKVLEETPSVLVNAELRARMGAVACQAARAVSYVGAGTVEFLVDGNKNFYFLEMNTRLQVEHPVTEMCLGIDLVELQIRVASGERLPFLQESIRPRGHAIEARVCAEECARDFMPSPGHIGFANFPAGPWVRADVGVASGCEVSRFYDPMIGKLIAWGETREHARRRLLAALRETTVTGITTNIAFLGQLLESQPFISGQYTTETLNDLLPSLRDTTSQELPFASILGALLAKRQEEALKEQQRASLKPVVSLWQNEGRGWGACS